MQKKNVILLSILLLALFSINTFSQDYIQDTLAVRVILDSNDLDTISVESVTDSGGGRIIKLQLRNSNLTSLPSEIGILTALEWLEITGMLTNLPAEIGNCKALKWFKHLGHLKSLPPEIGSLNNLLNLWLAENNIASLPPEIGSMTNLSNVHLESNNLTSLPDEIGNLNNLIELTLLKNNLISLPDSIIKLTPEDSCDLGYNKLDTVNLQYTIKTWLDKYDPDWRETQNVTDINNSIQKTALYDFSLVIKNSSILFNLTTSGNTRLHIFNMKGRLISTLVDTYKQAGKYTVNWDNKRYGSGVYYIKLSRGNNSIVKKAILIK